MYKIMYNIIYVVYWCKLQVNSISGNLLDLYVFYKFSIFSLKTEILGKYLYIFQSFFDAQTTKEIGFAANTGNSSICHTFKLFNWAQIQHEYSTRIVQYTTAGTKNRNYNINIVLVIQCIALPGRNPINYMKI